MLTRLKKLMSETLHQALLSKSRATFDHEKLESLAKTIKHQGIIQPLIVRYKSSGGYELIAGERRLKAAKIAGLRAVPCVVKENDNQSAAVMNLLENLHREDLNIVEEALFYTKTDPFTSTHTCRNRRDHRPI